MKSVNRHLAEPASNNCSPKIHHVFVGGLQHVPVVVDVGTEIPDCVPALDDPLGLLQAVLASSENEEEEVLIWIKTTSFCYF